MLLVSLVRVTVNGAFDVASDPSCAVVVLVWSHCLRLVDFATSVDGAARWCGRGEANATSHPEFLKQGLHSTANNGSDAVSDEARSHVVKKKKDVLPFESVCSAS